MSQNVKEIASLHFLILANSRYVAQKSTTKVRAPLISIKQPVRRYISYDVCGIKKNLSFYYKSIFEISRTQSVNYLNNYLL